MSTFSVDINTDYQSPTAVRFPVWIAMFVFSTVCLAATASTLKDRGSWENWVLSVTILSMILSFAAVAAYLFSRSIFVGQHPEGILILLLTVFWSVGLITIMNPRRQIAIVNQPGEGMVITNANLYFFSWLSFVCLMHLLGTYAQETAGYDVRQTGTKTASWYGLRASSIVVLASAVQVYHDTTECKDDGFSGYEYCRRTRLAIGVGTVSAMVAATITALAQRGLLQPLYETVTTTVLLALWCFGVGFITFGNTPGATISNLYFASWVSFILSVFLFGQCIRETLSSGSGSSGASERNQDGNNPENAVGRNPTVIVSNEEGA